MSILKKILGYITSKVNDFQEDVNKKQDNYSSKSDEFIIQELRRGGVSRKFAAKKELMDRGYSSDEVNNLMK